MLSGVYQICSLRKFLIDKNLYWLICRHNKLYIIKLYAFAIIIKAHANDSVSVISISGVASFNYGPYLLYFQPASIFNILSIFSIAKAALASFWDRYSRLVTHLLISHLSLVLHSFCLKRSVRGFIVYFGWDY